MASAHTPVSQRPGDGGRDFTGWRGFGGTCCGLRRVLTPSTRDGTLLRSELPAGVTEVKAQWLRVGLKPTTAVFIRRRKGHRHSENACEDGGRDWRDAPAGPGRQGPQATPAVKRPARAESVLEPFEGAGPCQLLNLRLLAPRTVRD